MPVVASVRGMESMDVVGEGMDSLEAEISRQHTNDNQTLSESAVAHLADRHDPIGIDERRRLLGAELHKLGHFDGDAFVPQPRSARQDSRGR